MGSPYSQNGKEETTIPKPQTTMTNPLLITILGCSCAIGIYFFFPLSQQEDIEQPTSIDLPPHEFPKPEYQWINPSYRYEIRIQNNATDERLEAVQTLDQALAYLKEYSMHHNDLFVYDLNTGRMVADCYVVGGGEGQVALD
mgnify:CR=1 FL=1